MGALVLALGVRSIIKSDCPSECGTHTPDPAARKEIVAGDFGGAERWLVALTAAGEEPLCSGTLVDLGQGGSRSVWVLTAAHCAKLNGVALARVGLGITQTHMKLGLEPGCEILGADLALLGVGEHDSNATKPLRLVDSLPATKAWSVGYGGAVGAFHPQSAEFDMLEPMRCKLGRKCHLCKGGQDYLLPFPHRLLCAGRNGHRLEDHDSGGALLVTIGATWQVAGVAVSAPEAGSGFLGANAFERTDALSLVGPQHGTEKPLREILNQIAAGDCPESYTKAIIKVL